MTNKRITLSLPKTLLEQANAAHVDIQSVLLEALESKLHNRASYVPDENERLLELDQFRLSFFVANMIHELRTSLNDIIGYSRIILKGIDGPLTERQQQDLNTLHESAKRLLDSVNDIIDKAKLETGTMELSRHYLSIDALIKGTIAVAASWVKDKPVTLRHEIRADLPQVWGDEFRCRQILFN